MVIPDSVTNVGSGVFHKNSSLQRVIIGKSVRFIGRDLFSYCDSLTEIVVHPKNKTFDSRGGCNAIVNTLSDTLVAGCGVTVIPESVKTIAEHAFACCTALTDIIIPKSVYAIGAYAFSYCSNLNELVIPSLVESIDIGIVAYTSLTRLIVDESNKNFDSRGGCNAIINSRTNSLIVGCSTTVIPEGVESISYYAFSGVDIPAKIVFPSTLKEIYSCAFVECDTLQSITLPDSVEVVQKMAFAKCSRLVDVGLGSSLKTIGEEAFGDCVALRELVIPASVEYIDDCAFAHCSSLSRVRFEQMTRVGDGVFYECSMLAKIEVPEEFIPIYELDMGEEYGELIKAY